MRRNCMNKQFDLVDQSTFNRMSKFEAKYLDLMEDILETGDYKGSRTGISTLSKFGGNVLSHSNISFDDITRPEISSVLGQQYHGEIHGNFSLTSCPILILRPIKFDVAWYETIMMLRGITNTQYLEDRGISIWKQNTTREFLDNRGLYDTPEKSLGKGYGYQWRNWNDEHDQLVEILNQIQDNPNSRRHVVSAWNPEQNKEAALDPCHILYQFNVVKGQGINYVDLQFYMRSSDVLFGLPFNMLSYYILLNLVVGYLNEVSSDNWAARDVFYVAGDSHIYENQIDYVKEYIDRDLDPKVDVEGHEIKTPILILPSPDLGSPDLTFDEYMIWVEENGYNLLYTPREAMETPRPAMAV